MTEDKLKVIHWERAEKELTPECFSAYRASMLELKDEKCDKCPKKYCFIWREALDDVTYGDGY